MKIDKKVLSKPARHLASNKLLTKKFELVLPWNDTFMIMFIVYVWTSPYPTLQVYIGLALYEVHSTSTYLEISSQKAIKGVPTELHSYRCAQCIVQFSIKFIWYLAIQLIGKYKQLSVLHNVSFCEFLTCRGWIFNMFFHYKNFWCFGKTFDEYLEVGLIFCRFWVSGPVHF